MSDFPLETVEVPALSITDTEIFITELAQRAHTNFDLQTGPLVKVYLLKDTPKNNMQLLLVVHHLLVDGVSWRILLDDLENRYSVPEKTNRDEGAFEKASEFSGSFQAWGNALKEYASTASLQSQYTYWEKICATHFSLPIDHHNGENLEETADIVSITLTPDETTSLLKINPKTHHLLIACLAHIISKWANTDALLLDLESQGRVDTLGVDISHTVGWFTSLFPVYLNYKKSASFEENINVISSQLNTVPHYGIDYGVLRYLTKNNKDLNYTPQVSFNYWGQLDTVFSKDSVFTIDTLKLISSPKNKRTHLLNIEAVIQNGKLKIEWVYSKNFHKKSTIQTLAEQCLMQLRKLTRTSLRGSETTAAIQATGTSSRRSAATVAIQVLKNNEGSPSIEKFSLTSMQKGLLFQSISTPNHGTYTVQLYWTLAPTICRDTFKQALQLLIDRHPILRTRFDWKQQEPLQLVEENMILSTKTYDWHTLSQSQQNTRFEEFLQADRNAGFSLDVVPLLRTTFIRTAEKTNIFILSLHHVLLDGWSIALLLRELNDAYHALSQHKSQGLLTLPAYFSYVDWLKHQDLKKSEIFWRAYLKGMTSSDLIHHTPLHKAHKNIENYAAIYYQTQFLVLSHTLSHTLRSFLKKHKITLNTFFQGLWAVLLHRYTQQEDIIFGTTVSVRPPELPHVDQMIGLMINTLPVRVNFSHDRSVIDYLSHLQNDFLTVLEHQYTPLTHIQAWGGLETNRTHELFETLMVVENYPVEELSELHVKFQDITIVDPTHYPLTLAVIPNEQITLKFAFDANRIDVGCLQDSIGHVQVLLNEFLQKPQQSIHQLDLLSAQEYQKIIVDWNSTLTHTVNTQTLHECFESQVERTPDNIALTFEGNTLTYQTLNEKANQLAHYLREEYYLKYGEQLKPNIIIALHIERGLEMIIGILGILKAGAAYLPIVSEFPTKRVAFMLQDSKVEMLLTQEHLMAHLKDTTQPLNIFVPVLISIDAEISSLEKMPKTNLPLITQPHHLMYVMYTSGSTGQPKGIAITHNNVMNLLLHDYQKKKNIAIGKNRCLWSNIGFDVSVYEIGTSLLSGCNLHILSDKTRLDSGAFFNYLKNYHINSAYVPPPLLPYFYDWLKQEKNLPSFKYLFLGVEPISEKLLRSIVDLIPGLCIVNAYGPTETTIFSTFYVFDEKTRRNKETIGKNIAIGKPCPNTQLYVVDNHLKPVPVGVVGELYIAGRGVADGYLNHPELTQQNFVPNPFSQTPFHRVYKTGDLVRWLSNGNLEFIGRTDDQVKIRGCRIELTEISVQLQIHPNVHQAIVLLRTVQKNKLLVAYVVKKKSITIITQELRNFLKQHLPDYMIPTSFIFLNKMPITANGKIDKKALLGFGQVKRIKKRSVPPKSLEEKKIADIWSQVLHIKKISVHDHFFEVGGNSFSVLKIISLIQTTFNVDITAQNFLTCPTVAELATLVQLLQKEKNAFSAATQKIPRDKFFNCVVPLKPNGSKAPLFLIHPVGGTVFWYIPLTKYLDPERPLYGIQDPGVEMDSIPFNTVEEMARFYIQAIRSIQPRGPYLIGGASGGANISVEIAHQFEIMGEDTTFIGLLDGWAPFPDMLKNQAFFEANMRRQYNAMHQQFLAKGIQKAETLLNLQWQRSQMLANYHAPVLLNKLTLFKAIDTISVFQPIDSPFNHWEKHSAQLIELHQIPGDHESMIQEPHVAILAKQLNTCLAPYCKQEPDCVMV